jgi:hypothetical protein
MTTEVLGGIRGSEKMLILRGKIRAPSASTTTTSQNSSSAEIQSGESPNIFVPLKTNTELREREEEKIPDKL